MAFLSLMGIEEICEAPTGRRLRLLCLHGFRTSANILRRQLCRWDDSIHDILDLTYLQAPLPAAGKSEGEGFFPPPYFEWFRFNKEFTECEGLQEAIEYVGNYLKNNGPFDGLLGFSQGAILAAYLVSLQEKGLALQNVDPLRVIVIISGAKLSSPELASVYEEGTIRCPSVHFIGRKDYLRNHGEELVKCFQSPFVMEHSEGHSIPQLDLDTTLEVVDYLMQVRQELAITFSTGKIQSRLLTPSRMLLEQLQYLLPDMPVQKILGSCVVLLNLIKDMLKPCKPRFSSKIYMCSRN